jgi:hypothetical protein
MFASLVLAANLFLSTFAGTWLCTPHEPGAAPARVTIGPVADSPWVEVRWRADGRGGGRGFVGFVKSANSWIYEDFRDDGSFVTSTSPGPQSGVWTFSGLSMAPDREVHGTSVWRIVDPHTMRRAYGRSIGSEFLEQNYELCRRTP